ncbi:MAG: hypothetical protein OEX19_09605 [Gammaproteobacteria bacterium]|nr:hypothetical protein [Gammaproteobacteria bacterium]
MTFLNKNSLLLILSLTLASSPLSAKTIVGFGMSQQSGGVAINKELALARANEFLAQQASIATFVYRKTDRKISFERFLRTKLNNVKIAKRETLKNSGVAIWLQADADIPTYTDARCQPVKQSLDRDKNSDRVLMGMLEQSIPDLLKPSLKKGREVKGLSYLRKLSVEKNWLGNYSITAEVCVAQLTVR